MKKYSFFNESLKLTDQNIECILKNEFYRQRCGIELIASENLVSKAVLETQGSILTNKYAEGYPGKRYYGGCKFVDEVEQLAINRAKKLFKVSYVNVQPNSGSQMNQAVFLALLRPGDTILGLDLKSGGHLTHGSSVNMSGKWFNAISYQVRRDDNYIDMDDVIYKALKFKPKLIIAGGTAYSRIWDWRSFRKIADLINAILLVDMSHIAGLVAGGVHPSPFPHCHIATTTTHKSLRGPRGGLILTEDLNIFKKINFAVFPGLQGGPLMHVIAAKAVALGEALKPSFKLYVKSVIDNAKILCNTLINRGYSIVSNGTDNHIVLLNLSKFGITGKAAEQALNRSYITCNKNTIPFDTQKPLITSGIRLGTFASTTRGFMLKEFVIIGNIISDILDILKNKHSSNLIEIIVRKKVLNLTKNFPIYKNWN